MLKKIKKLFRFLEFERIEDEAHYRDMTSLEAIIALRDERIVEFKALVKSLRDRNKTLVKRTKTLQKKIQLLERNYN